jgi:hypothetical protein
MGWGGVAQVVEHLPRQHKALSSKPGTAKKKKRKEKKCVTDDIQYHSVSMSCKPAGATAGQSGAWFFTQQMSVL